MTTPSKFYNSYPANLPPFSGEEPQALRDYDEKLIEAQVEDGEICWENLHERCDMAQPATETDFEMKEEQSSNSLCLDPWLQNAGTTAVEHHNSQILAMNAFLHLQQQEDQLQQKSSINNDHSRHAHTRKQTQLAMSTGPAFQSPIDQNLLPPYHAPSLPRVAESLKKPAALAPERLIPLVKPTQYPQVGSLRDKPLDDHGAFKINLPSISFLLHPDDGYDHPPIHFPFLSYVFEETTNNHDHKSHDSVSERTESQPQRITPNTRFSTPILPPSTDNNPATNPSPPSPTHSTLEQTPSHLSPKKIKKGTEPKKPHVPTRRWSRTHLNQLMREHRPRNLPETIALTDYVHVQDVPIQKLTPAYCKVKAGLSNGDTVFFGAGTRVEVPLETSSSGLVIPKNGGILDSDEKHPVMKRTPFRLVVSDRQGNIKVDMIWCSNVAVNDPVDTGLASQSETRESVTMDASRMLKYH